jgi:hypothetical protein
MAGLLLGRTALRGKHAESRQGQTSGGGKGVIGKYLH